MGGLVCGVHRNAILTFQAVPTSPPQCALFDEQMRRLLSTIAQDLVNDAPAKVETACDILAKDKWDLEDRTTLLDIVESLYET